MSPGDDWYLKTLKVGEPVWTQVSNSSRSLIGNMKDPLMEMGMKDAFMEGEANFKGINGANDLWLSEFSQLNQLVVGGGGPLQPPRSRSFFRNPPRRRRQGRQSSKQRRQYQLHFERQFMYAVRHNPSGLILNVGRYYVPVT